ncbi:MAG: hypothetical protein AAF467_15155 [Actinomycetota bacterium]
MGLLRHHLIVYGVLLAAIVAVVPLDASFGSDDGAYAAQVYALRQNGIDLTDPGHWALSRPLPVVAQPFEGWLNAAVTSAGPTPYTANPAYSILLTVVAGLVHGPVRAGETAGSLGAGLHLVPLAAAMAAAAVAWALASTWRRDAAPLAFWLVGLSPLLVSATTLWAHTLAGALGGLSVLALARLVRSDHRRRQVAWAMLLMLALTAAAVVRSEAVLWIVALAAGAVAARSRVALLAAVPACAVAGTAWFVARAWGASLRADRLPVETSILALTDQPSWLAGRAPAAWLLLLAEKPAASTTALTIAGVILAAFAGWRARTTLGANMITIALVAAAGVYVVRSIQGPGMAITGLFGAWPVALCLLIAGAGAAVIGDGSTTTELRAEGLTIWTRASSLPITPFLVVPALVLTAAVLATQHANSGGLQWGGRYLSFLIVPVAAAAAVTGIDHVRRHRVGFAALMVAPAIAGVVTAATLHRGHHRIVEAATAPGAPVVVTEFAELPRIAWPALPTTFYRAQGDTVGFLLDDLAEAGVSHVTIHGLESVPLDGTAGYTVVATDGIIRTLELTSPVEPASPEASVRPSP